MAIFNAVSRICTDCSCSYKDSNKDEHDDFKEILNETFTRNPNPTRTIRIIQRFRYCTSIERTRCVKKMYVDGGMRVKVGM